MSVSTQLARNAFCFARMKLLAAELLKMPLLRVDWQMVTDVNPEDGSHLNPSKRRQPHTSQYTYQENTSFIFFFNKYLANYTLRFV
jgi:hypothetical protein